MTDSSRHPYQVGGSLRANDPNYVYRQADEALYQLMQDGELCYVFNCRQMGKSSLSVQVRNRLLQEGVCCISLDLTLIGGSGSSVDSWYRSLIQSLHGSVRSLLRLRAKTWEDVGQLDLAAWQHQYEALIQEQGITPVQLLNRYFKELLLEVLPERRFAVFIDEIDKVLTLGFDYSDFLD